MRLGVAAALVGGELLPGDVAVGGGRVEAVGLGASSGSRIAAPGFVDLQVNGYAGVDFSAAGEDGYRVAGATMLRDGVTAFQPTIVSAPIEAMIAALGRLPRADRRRGIEGPSLPPGSAPLGDAGTSDAGAPMPRLIGAHVEGPFLAPARAGAHPPESLQAPDPAALERLLAAGPVTQVTLAPELPGALDLVEVLNARGVTVSCGHSEADTATAGLAFDRGATVVTHVFNAMGAFAPRDPGIAFAALARAGVFVTLVADGHHLAADTVRVAAAAAGERLVLITDAVAAAAAPDGEYTLGGTVPVRSEGGVVRDSRGALAGSTVSMPAAVRNLHALGVPLGAALRAATEAPARMARRPDLGRIAPGAPADLVVLDDALAVERVLVDGMEAFSR